MVGNHSPCHAEKPQAVLRGGGNHIKAAPRNQEDLRDDVVDLVGDHAPANIGDDRPAVDLVEGLETVPKVAVVRRALI